MTTHHHLSPDEVVARIPTSALRDICARDPHLKHLSADLVHVSPPLPTLPLDPILHQCPSP